MSPHLKEIKLLLSYCCFSGKNKPIELAKIEGVFCLREISTRSHDTNSTASADRIESNWIPAGTPLQSTNTIDAWCQINPRYPIIFQKHRLYEGGVVIGYAPLLQNPNIQCWRHHKGMALPLASLFSNSLSTVCWCHPSVRWAADCFSLPLHLRYARLKSCPILL